MAHGFLQVQMTTDSRESADDLVRATVGARLAACGQVVGPISSTFWWQGEIQKAEEYLILLKTTEDRFAELVERVSAAHPYDTPEIIAVRLVAGHDGYLAWVAQETDATADPPMPAEAQR